MLWRASVWKPELAFVDLIRLFINTEEPGPLILVAEFYPVIAYLKTLFSKKPSFC